MTARAENWGACLRGRRRWRAFSFTSSGTTSPGCSAAQAISGIDKRVVAAVVAIYVSVNFAYLALLGPVRVAASDALAAEAVGEVVGEVGGRLVAAGVAVSAFGVLNAQLLSGPRLVLELARDGRFFAVFGRLHPRFATPAWAIGLLGGVALVILISAGSSGISAIDRILNGVVLVDGLFFALTGLAVPWIALRARSTRAALMPRRQLIAPLIFVVVELGVVLGAWLDPSVRGASWVGVCWIAGAAMLYLVRFRGAAPDDVRS